MFWAIIISTAIISFLIMGLLICTILKWLFTFIDYKNSLREREIKALEEIARRKEQND